MHLYRRLFDRACGALKGGTLDVEYWDGASVTYGHGEPRVGLKLRRPGIVPGLLLNPELCFGEAYMRGDLEIAGEIEAFLVVTATNDLPASAFFDHLGRFALALSRLQPLSIGRHRRDVRRHYDLGNDFYRLWLDPTMSYSCAMFQSPDEDLETAPRR